MYQEIGGYVRIGILGPANAGKDTVAAIIAKATGGNFKVKSFSDELYKEISEAFQVPISLLQNREGKEDRNHLLRIEYCRNPEFRDLCHSLNVRIFSPREVLEVWATAFRREQNPDYWLTAIKSHIGNLVVPGVRFSNELELMNVSIIVRRPGFEVLRDHVSDELWRNHTELPVIWNTGTIQELYRTIPDVLAVTMYD